MLLKAPALSSMHIAACSPAPPSLTHAPLHSLHITSHQIFPPYLATPPTPASKNCFLRIHLGLRSQVFPIFWAPSSDVTEALSPAKLHTACKVFCAGHEGCGIEQHWARSLSVREDISNYSLSASHMAVWHRLQHHRNVLSLAVGGLGRKLEENPGYSIAQQIPKGLPLYSARQLLALALSGTALPLQLLLQP